MIKTQHCPNCETTEQKLHDFQQEVSDAVADAKFMIETHCDEEASTLLNNRLSRFIIPKPQPDPLVAALYGVAFVRWRWNKVERSSHQSLVNFALAAGMCALLGPISWPAYFWNTRWRR